MAYTFLCCHKKDIFQKIQIYWQWMYQVQQLYQIVQDYQQHHRRRHQKSQLLFSCCPDIRLIQLQYLQLPNLLDILYYYQLIQLNLFLKL